PTRGGLSRSRATGTARSGKVGSAGYGPPSTDRVAHLDWRGDGGGRLGPATRWLRLRSAAPARHDAAAGGAARVFRARAHAAARRGPRRAGGPAATDA